MEMKKVRQIYDNISRFTYFNIPEKNDYIQITEWMNQEGYDINIGENKQFSLSHGELEAINYLIKVMENDFKE